MEKRHGNILQADTEALVNTVNTVGVMGRGIALAFKRAFPENYKAYRKACQQDRLKPGDVFAFTEASLLGSHRRVIFNVATKQHWQSKSKLEYIATGLQNLRHHLLADGVSSVAVPALGCGNGGLRWEQVYPLIEEYLGDLEGRCNVVVYEPPPDNKYLRHAAYPQQKVRLTPARTLLLSALFEYDAMGEQPSRFSTNKLGYLLKRVGFTEEFSQTAFKLHTYGPYNHGLDKMLQDLKRGAYVHGNPQDEEKAFEPLELNYAYRKTVKDTLQQYLVNGKAAKFDRLKQVLAGFESELSLEVLTTLDWRLKDKPQPTLADAFAEVRQLDERKRGLFKDYFVRVAYEHWMQFPELRANPAQ